MDAILHAIRGLGGMVLKTDVDLEPAKPVQELRSEDKQTASKAFNQQLIMQLLRASVGSTEASESLPARVGVVGPKRAEIKGVEPPGRRLPRT